LRVLAERAGAGRPPFDDTLELFGTIRTGVAQNN
jgi:hypothetical protein